MSTPKYEIIATKKNSKERKNQKRFASRAKRRSSGQRAKTTRTKGHHIKQAAQIGNRVKNSSVTMPRQIPDLA